MHSPSSTSAQDLGASPAPGFPLSNDPVTMAEPATCPICTRPFHPRGRQRWCSNACRQSAFRRRRHAQVDDVPVMPARVPRADVIYECPLCEARYLGEQRCPECQTFCRRVGPGGLCPHCQEPVAHDDLRSFR